MRLSVNHFLPMAALALLSACGSGSNNRPQTAIRPATQGPAADYPMVIGAPFDIDGITHTPSDKWNYDEVGYAQVADDGGSAISGAHKTLPVPSYVEVTSLATGKTILVRIERRGPMRNDAVLELSPGAAAQIGFVPGANAPIRLRRVNPPEVERSMLRRGERVPDRMNTPKALVEVLMRKLTGRTAGVTNPMAAKPMPTPVDPDAVPVRTAALPLPIPAKPVGEPKPSSPVKVTVGVPARPAPLPVRPVMTKGALVVQAAAFSSRDRAQNVADTLGGSVAKPAQYWLVRLGPFSSQADADGALAKVRAAGYSDARILRAE